MDETLILPSPNWFLNSNLAVSTDGWVVYGGPNKSVCVLEPRKQDGLVVSGKQSYQAHMAPRAHQERVIFVDLSPEFLNMRNFLTGGDDGVVKQWTLEFCKDNFKIKTTHTHKIHYNENENIAGIGYSTNTIAISVGSLGNIVKWDLTANICKTYTRLTNRFKPTCLACSPHLPLNIAVGTKQGVIFVLDLEGPGKIVYKVRGQDEEIIHLGWCPQYEISVNKTLEEFVKKSTATKRLEAIRNGVEKVHLELSGVQKKLPEDSFDETVLVEDDTFNIYKDHKASEFGHKKYKLEDIITLKVNKDVSNECNYLAECLKLKEAILNNKKQQESSIEKLVEAIDKTHVSASVKGDTDKSNEGTEKIAANEASVHPHTHLLATISKFGGVQIWSKSGKLVGSCTVPCMNKNLKGKNNGWPSLLWHKPDSLLLVDVRSQLLECNPLVVDSKNMLSWNVVHSLHKRGLYAIVSDAPRIQTAYDSPESPFYYESEKWSVYTIAQDRNLIKYSLKKNEALAIYNTAGGFTYNVQLCPYDAGKIAVAVGDGAVRVWRSTTLIEDETKLYPGVVQTYWQNVQGKVLTCAWHPTKENLLAFGTGESRVGLLDTCAKSEKPARLLSPAVNGSIYSLCWGEDMQLYVNGGPDLVVYNASAPTQAPTPIEVKVEEEVWAIGSVQWSPRGLLVGSHLGAIAMLDDNTHQVQAVAFIFSKMIHSMEWHSEQTSNSDEESPYKDFLAVSSQDKSNNIIITEYKDKEDGGKEFVVWKTLSGHSMCVLQLQWSPHREGLLLSTSQDATVRVWNVLSGECISIFGNHNMHTLGASWFSMPQLETKILSGGGDCCLRLWDYNEHKSENYERKLHDSVSLRKSEKKDKKLKEQLHTDDSEENPIMDIPRRPSKRFLLPTLQKQMSGCKFPPVWRMYKKLFDKDAKGEDNELYSDTYDVDFIKIFGNTNEINEVLDKEMDSMLKHSLYEPWMMLCIFRGNIDAMIKFAIEKNLLTPYLISIAPSVSFKYWKDTMQLYVAQVDRIVRDGEEKLCDRRLYGGSVYRKVAALLSLHDVKAAVTTLIDASMYKEAYVLCRIRYMDSIAEQTLRLWAKHCYNSGNICLSTICYMVLGDISDAANMLSKCTDKESLSLAVQLAKLAGRNVFADQMEKKAQTHKSYKDNTTEEELSQLPSRMELLMKDVDNDVCDPNNDNKDVETSVNDGSQITLLENGEKNVQNGDN